MSIKRLTEIERERLKGIERGREIERESRERDRERD